jgi:hypothetical protein
MEPSMELIVERIMEPGMEPSMELIVERMATACCPRRTVCPAVVRPRSCCTRGGRSSRCWRSAMGCMRRADCGTAMGRRRRGRRVLWGNTEARGRSARRRRAGRFAWMGVTLRLAGEEWWGARARRGRAACSARLRRAGLPADSNARRRAVQAARLAVREALHREREPTHSWRSLPHRWDCRLRAGPLRSSQGASACSRSLLRATSQSWSWRLHSAPGTG